MERSLNLSKYERVNPTNQSSLEVRFLRNELEKAVLPLGALSIRPNGHINN